MKVKQKKVPKKDSHITVPSSLQERRKIKLKLNLKPFLFTNTFIQETKFNLVSTPTELCSTADMEKYTNGIETTYLNTRVDGKGNTFFKFSNNLIFKKGNKILSNGQQGEVDSVTAYTPHQTRSYHLVKKTGKEVIKREVSFLRAMNKSMGISLNSIQKIVHWQGDVTRTSYYSRYEKGGDLKLHQPYIQEQYHLNDKNVLSYLFSIMMQLAEGLSVLHDSQFKDEGGGIHFGIVHNDLKPANIFVKENGHIVIADFGCAY
ncbi:MAG: protein kinase, partial [Rickettsiella sp.]|nr:protein kinase [Rickettsiella sp.]